MSLERFQSGCNRPQPKNTVIDDIIYLLCSFILTLVFCFWFLIKCNYGFIKKRLGIPDLGIDEKYQSILQNYGRDIEMVSRIYMKQKLDPPIGRDLPPVSGRIMWARQLLNRIQGPMDLFQQVILTFWPPAKKIWVGLSVVVFLFFLYNGNVYVLFLNIYSTVLSLHSMREFFPHQRPRGSLRTSTG